METSVSFKLLKTETGSFAVISALFMFVIIGMLALVLNLGFFYWGKNKYQNAVEAAAMAGALALCSSSYEEEAKFIALENGLSEEGLIISPGFYDEKDIYENFLKYKNFVAEGDDDYPYDEYNNAVMVTFQGEKKALLGSFLGDEEEEVTVNAGAVAYLPNYGIISLSDNAGSEINVDFYRDNFPEFEKCDIHSNNNVRFKTDPTLTDSDVTATGNIFGCSACSDDYVKKIKMKPVDWDRLKQRADETGGVFTWRDFEGYSATNPNFVNGNILFQVGTNNRLVFHPKEGDHGGVVYYFDSTGSPSEPVSLYISWNRSQVNSMTNFTLASEFILAHGSGSTGQNSGLFAGPLGGENKDMVFIYCKEDIAFNGKISDKLKGVSFLTEGDFTLNLGSINPDKDYFLKFRLIAGGKIKITRGMSSNPFRQPDIFNFSTNFSSPCPAIGIKLGTLH